MEVSKLPSDVSMPRAGTPAAAAPGPQSADTRTADTPVVGDQAADNQAADSIAPLADRADIRPLDISGALQILLAEVRAELDLSLSAAIPQGTATQGTAPQVAARTPTQIARELVELFLQALPEDASDAPVWTAALVRVDAAVQSSMERAISVVTQWQDVPAVAVDAVKDARALFVAALADDPPNPLWLRPEWLGLGPPWQRFLRRRRNSRRRLTDPDYPSQCLDESEEFHR